MNYFGSMIKPCIHRSLRLFLFLLVSSSVVAKENSSEANETLKIVNATMPAVPPVSRTAAVYLTLQNLSDQTIIINSVETEIARHAMFHQTIEQNGVAKMQHRDELVIPAKQSLSLVAGGIHIMLMGLKEIPSNNQFELILGSEERKYQVLVNILDREKK